MKTPVLVSIEGADLFLFYDPSDEATLRAQLADPRAKIISPEAAHPTWRQKPASLDDAWSIRGQGLFSLAAVHFWRNGIDFDYIDVGANVGMTTIAQAIFFGRCQHANHTYAFEPSPIFDLLSQSVGINDASDRITCVRAALGDMDGRAVFYVTPDKTTSSSLSQAAVSRPGIEHRTAMPVDVLTMDGFAANLRQAPGLLVKIDAEGCDLQVLAGARKTFGDRLTVFQIEVFPSIMGRPDLVADLAELSQRYAMVEVGGSQRRAIDEVSMADFIADVSARQPVPASDILAIDKRIQNYAALVERVLAD